MNLNKEEESKKSKSWLDFFLEILPNILDFLEAVLDILSTIDFGE